MQRLFRGQGGLRQQEEWPTEENTDNRSHEDVTRLKGQSSVRRFSTHQFFNNDQSLLVDLLRVALITRAVLVALRLHRTGLRNTTSLTRGAKHKQ